MVLPTTMLIRFSGNPSAPSCPAISTLQNVIWEDYVIHTVLPGSKLTIDGSYKLEDGTAGYGMAIRDEANQVILSACTFVEHYDSPRS